MAGGLGRRHKVRRYATRAAHRQRAAPPTRRTANREGRAGPDARGREWGMTLEDNKTVVPNDPPGIPRALLERAVRSQLGIAGLQLGDVHVTPVAEFRVTTGNTY